MKQRRMRTGIRTATKSQEEELIAKANRLRDDPFLFLPSCDEKSCVLCPFSGLKGKLLKIQSAKDKKSSLGWAARWGDPLARAYAVMLILAIDESATHLAVAKYPFGKVSFLYRSGVPKEKLIGIQYFDDPHLRLLAYLDIAAKRKMRLYSTKKNFVCAGRDTAFPDFFLSEALYQSKVRFRKEPNSQTYLCDHLYGSPLDETDVPHMKICSSENDSTVALCDDCARRSGGNTLSLINQSMLVPDQKNAFSVQVASRPDCAVKTECDACPAGEYDDLEHSLAERYISGEASDGETLQKHLDARAARLADEGLFINDNNCYGKDEEAFIKALNPAPEEAAALTLVFGRTERGFVGEKLTPSKVLSQYWNDYGEDVLADTLGDKEAAKKLFEKTANLRDNPSKILKDAIESQRRDKLLSAYPRYEGLSQMAQFIDDVARAHLVGGAEEALRVIDRSKADDVKTKSAAFAFLLFYQKGDEKRWHYSKIEMERAEFLKELVGKLVASKPENYNENLQFLAAANGSTEEIKPIK